MNQCSPVEVHSLREARALSRVSCQFSVASSQLTITTEHGHRVSTTGNGALTTDNLLEMGEKSEGKISAPGDLLRHCADLRLCWIEENSVHRATYCAIAWIIIARAGWRKSQCTGRPTAPIITRYRCFLPDLAGLAGLRRVGPGTGTILSLNTLLRRTAPLHPCKTCPQYSLQLT